MQIDTVEGWLDFPAEADPEGRHVVIWGQTFPAALLARAGALGIDVEVTLYFAASKSEPEAGA